jgi:hypothetical protein
VPNFVKDEDEVAKIINFMKKQSEFLKTVFIIKSSQSYFPVIRFLNFSQMVAEWEINSADFLSDAVDRIYIAVTKNMNKALVGTLPEKDMSRF